MTHEGRMANMETQTAISETRAEIEAIRKEAREQTEKLRLRLKK